MKVYISGRFFPKNKALVSVFDHGLLYGDGVFEGIRSYNGRVFLLNEHLERLYRSAKSNSIEHTHAPARWQRPWLSPTALTLLQWLHQAGSHARLARLGLILIFAASRKSSLLQGKSLYPKELYETGLHIVTAGTRNHTESLNPCIKSLNYLNNIMAKIEAINAGAMETLMLNQQGYVAEASGDNVFAVRGNKLITPPVSCGALDGITRAVVMDIAAKSGMEVREDVMTRYDLYTADEVFLTGTGAEIIGVVDIDRRVIGNGKPGAVTRDLERKFHDFARVNGTPIALHRAKGVKKP